MKKLVIVFVLLLPAFFSFAQSGDLQPFDQDLNNGSNTGKDSSLGFEHRDDAKDSITIHFRYLDSIRNNPIDASLDDFYKYFVVPENLQYLGNDGSAGYPLIYSPLMKAGWDAGFHAFDACRYTLEDTRFFKTTKPFSELDYQLASGQEQTVKVLHTQNPKPNLNFGFEYKLISAPGFFATQNNNENSYRLFTNYQGKRKRYALFFTLVGNVIKSSDNGGMQSDSFLKNPDYSARFTIPVNLGGDAVYQPSPFQANVNTGNIYNDMTVFLRQTYDIGKKDSVAINDSTTEYLFYPKLRFQYSLTASSYSYQFIDNQGDSDTYQKWYNYTLPSNSTIDTFSFKQKWSVVKNDFSLIQFPDTKNQSEFFLAGARIENIKGSENTTTNISTSSIPQNNFHNIVLHAEYRNKTKNKLWDIDANGELYANGLNSGDYNAYASLQRQLNKKLGNVRLIFNNINRSQSFIYNPVFSFQDGTTANYKKENITLIQATTDNPFIHLSASDYFINNLAYFTDYYHTAQYGKPINILELNAAKKIKFSKHLSLYLAATVQETDPAAPVRVPLVFTRSRFAYEGTYYQNLTFSMGIEARYYTPYKGDNYSPIVGQFFKQDSVTINNLPDISAFLHFRIKTFTAYIRAENLNTINFKNGFGFTNNNFAAPNYVYPGFIFRFGVQWRFVN